MSYLPIYLEISDRRCLVAGGGQVALRRVKTLLDLGAAVVVVAPDVDPELEVLARAGRIEWKRKLYDAACLDCVSLVVAATNDGRVNEQIVADSKTKTLFVCRADRVEKGDFLFPAVVQRGGLILSVATGGSNPALTSVVQDRLATEYGPEWEALVALFGDLRPEMKKNLESAELRKEAVRRILADSGVRQLLRDGMNIEAEARARECLSSVLE